MCKSRIHSKQIEQEFIEKHQADLNMVRAFLSDEQRREEQREYRQKYNAEHADEIRKYQQKYMRKRRAEKKQNKI